MFNWFKHKSPLTNEQRRAIDNCLVWLVETFGTEHLENPMITPTDDFFPERYSANLNDAEVLFDRICSYMSVDRGRLELLFENQEIEQSQFFSKLSRANAEDKYDDSVELIPVSIEKHLLDDWEALIQAMSNILAQVQLLLNSDLEMDDPSYGPLTDLLAIYFGFGIFTANRSITESNWHQGNWSGWSMSTHGYLSMPEFGYALAVFADVQEENKPDWLRFLRRDLKSLVPLELKNLKTSSESLRGIDRLFSRSQSEATSTSTETSSYEPDRNHAEPSDLDYSIEAPEFDEDDFEEELPGNGEADMLFVDAMAKSEAGEYGAAIKLFNAAIDLDSDDAEVWYERSQAFFILGDYQAAANDCSRALELDAHYFEAFRGRSLAFVHLKMYKQALADASKAILDSDQDPLTLLALGLCHLGLNNPKRALKFFSTGVRFAPESSDLFLARSRAYEQLQDKQRAEADMSEAIRLNPQLSDPSLRSNSIGWQ